MNNKNFTIITFYKFKINFDKSKLVSELNDFCKFNKIKGTIIIANEGINGTISGFEKDVNRVIDILKKFNFNNLKIKFAYSKYMPFQKLKIKQKKEIVSLRTKYSNPEIQTGRYVSFNQWNDIVNDKKTILIDVRNDFEIQMGSFRDAINPNIKNFAQFKDYVKINLNNSKDKKIAMFCTGGIRCEKASSYLLAKGFKNVSQLDGGILKYLQNTPKGKSLWNGECFVFDGRVSVKNELKHGTYKMCYACRMPLSVKESSSQKYISGISCPKCYKKISNDKKKRLIERNKQISISKKRGLYNRYIKQSVKDY
ncbi:rhodanese-related sulfurtransferase [Pelagibacteraceae bacterium]|nr:rhodanese-related sulfurtransferase [Pelagibacteraceae bacterium]